MGAVGLALSLGVALVALPFIRLMLWRRGAGRKEMRLAGNVFLGVLGVGVLPFFLWGPPRSGSR